MHESISRKKIYALFLIAPLLWIHSVKFFHSHSTSLPCENGLELIIKTPGAAGSSSHCTICDYQVNKDFVLPDISFKASIQQVFCFHNSEIVELVISSLTQINSDRAPPVI